MLQLSDSVKIYGPPGNHADGEPTTNIAPAIPTDIPAFLTATQLGDGIRHRYDRIHAIEIEYDYTARTFIEDVGHVPFCEYHFAYSGPKRLKVQSNVTIDGQYVYPHHFWVWDTKVQQNFNVESKVAYIKPNKDDWVERDLYLFTAGVPIESFDKEWERVKGTCMRPWLFQLVDRNWRWEVLPYLENVDGAPCHVLQSNFKDKLWIDPEIGCGARMLENYRRDKKSGFEEWPLVTRVAFSDHRPTTDDCWLPWRINVVGYFCDDDKDSRFGDPCRCDIRRIKKLAVNEDVPESLFALEYPVGTVVRDAVRKHYYCVGENGEELKISDWS